jgi:predicted SnoaL-like aldol condensation-catalyzing enzyme
VNRLPKRAAVDETVTTCPPRSARTGRRFVGFFSRFKKPSPIAPKVGAPLVAITAERDLVVLTFVRELPDPKDPATKYTTTWFDMFRVEAGKIAEHWDPAVKP